MGIWLCITEALAENLILLLLVVVGNMESARIFYSIKRQKTDNFILWSTDILLPILSYRASLGEENNPDGGRGRIVVVWTVLLEIIRTTLVHPRESLKTLEQCFRIFWVMYLVYGKRSLQGLRILLFALCIVGLAFEIFKAVTLKRAEKSSKLGKNPKYIAIYMNRIVKEEDDSNKAPPATNYNYLENSKYLISGEKNDHNSFFDTTNVNPLAAQNNLLTVGKLFQLNSESDKAFHSKYPCLREIGLSFALAKMLRRRFSQLPLAEAGTKNALSFVTKGLMHSSHANKDSVSQEVDEENAQRVFRIITNELRILTDILYIEVSAFYNFFGLLVHGSLLVLLICTSPYIFWSINHKRSTWISTSMDLYTKCAGNVNFSMYLKTQKIYLIFFDNYVTYLLLITWFIKLYVWMWSYYNPNWRTYRIFECYLKDPTKLPKMHNIQKNYQKSFRPLLENLSRLPIIKIFAKIIMSRQAGKKKLSWLKVDVQKALLTSFKRSEGKLTSGQSSLERHNVHGLKWACQGQGQHQGQRQGQGQGQCQHQSQSQSQSPSQSQTNQSNTEAILESNTEAILVWHIATTLFDDYDHSSDKQSGDRTIALALSKYCELLLKHYPELLPDGGCWAEGLLKRKDEEISKSKTSDSENDRSKSEVCRIRDGKWNEHSVLGRGVRLFNELKETMENNNDHKDVWKILAEFWAEMMLYIAPSDNVKGHEEILEKRELITQLWALISHAGIINYKARPQPQPQPQPHSASATGSSAM